jgi:hypothetical protein
MWSATDVSGVSRPQMGVWIAVVEIFGAIDQSLELFQILHEELFHALRGYIEPPWVIPKPVFTSLGDKYLGRKSGGF